MQILTDEPQLLLTNYEQLYQSGTSKNRRTGLALKDNIEAFIKSCKGQNVAIIIDEYNGTRDFRVYCQLTARSEDHYKNTIGFCFFNLNGRENEQGKYTNGKNACYSSYATYGSSSYVFTQYKMVSYSNTSNSLSYGWTYDYYDNWNNSYNEYLNEWTERGFKACGLANILVN